MKYRLNRNSFVRHIGNYGYVYSQLTKHDRSYDASGSVFLNALSRGPCEFNSIFEKVMSAFVDAPADEVRNDLREFLDDLIKDNYLTCGETSEECDKNELLFSYDMENSKTATFNYLQNKEDLERFRDTTELFFEEHHKTPRIHSCQIELTNRCNERCIHCYIPHELKNKTLSTEIIFDVFEQLHEMGTLGLTLSGGEALCHPDICKILRKARELDFSINLLSNITLMSDEILECIKEINPSLVQTSLYSMIPEEHDKITQLKGSQQKTFHNLERLIEAQVPVQISCPTMKTNFRSYKQVLEWASAHRCKSQTDFIMMARTDFSTDNLDERLSLDETKELIRDMLVADVDYGEYLEDYKPDTDIEKIKEQPICGVGVDNICLAANGTYYPCSGWQGLPVGTVKQRLKDVWENSPQLKMLRNIKKKSFPKCLSCEDKDFCAMCLVRNFNESGGDMMKINNHFCKVAKINKELVETNLKANFENRK
jgi:putative radical SAM domain protein